MAMNAGKLDQLVRILELGAVEGGFAWAERRKAWAHAELTDRTNIFSSVGLGARTAVFTIRRQSVDLSCAILWGEQHCFLTAITPTPDKVHLTVTAAMVTLADCVADADRETAGPAFPAALTEKYVRHERLEPMDEATVCYVLVTPKAVTLAVGSLVTVNGTAYHVLAAHELDPYKNEYEAERAVNP